MKKKTKRQLQIEETIRLGLELKRIEREVTRISRICKEVSERIPYLNHDLGILYLALMKK